MINKLLVLLLLFTVPSLAQRQLVKGRVENSGYGAGGILVVNVKAERETRTDAYGEFVISAKVGDTLIVTDPKILDKEVVVVKQYLSGVIKVLVDYRAAYVLDEVVIEKDNSLTAEGLGIVSADVPRYTPGERRVKEASEIKASDLMLLRLPVNQIINAISGRTKQLKRDLKTEQKEFAIDGAALMFTNAEITEKFNIPAESVNGFLFYCAEDAAFRDAVNENNEMLTAFLMSGLSVKYIEANKQTTNED